MIIPVVVTNSTANGSYRKKDKSHDEALIAELLERCGGEMRKNTLVATHGDYEFHLRFDARDGTFHLIIPCVHAGRFKLRLAASLTVRVLSATVKTLGGSKASAVVLKSA